MGKSKPPISIRCGGEYLATNPVSGGAEDFSAFKVIDPPLCFMEGVDPKPWAGEKEPPAFSPLPLASRLVQQNDA